jgi:hypothetical protein
MCVGAAKSCGWCAEGGRLTLYRREQRREDEIYRREEDIYRRDQRRGVKILQARDEIFQLTRPCLHTQAVMSRTNRMQTIEMLICRTKCG